MAKPLGRSTMGRRLSAIVFAHRAAGFDPPTQQPDGARLEKAMRAIRRDKRDDPSYAEPGEHTPTGAESTSAPHPQQDPIAQAEQEKLKRDKLDQ